jgi:hypothetical protein
VTDPYSNFWEAFDECKRQVRAEHIRRERVVLLRDDITPAQRRAMAQQLIEGAATQVHLVPDDEVGDRMLQAIDTAIASLTRKRSAVLMHRALVCLSGQFGRAST